MREALTRLPRSKHTLPPVDELDAVLAGLQARADDGASLDAAMDEVQARPGSDQPVAIVDAFVRSDR